MNTKFNKTFAVLIAAMWIFVFPWLQIVSSFKTETLVIMGFGAVLAVLTAVIWLLVNILNKLQADSEPTEKCCTSRSVEHARKQGVV